MYEIHPVHTAIWSISTQNENHKLEDRVRSVYHYETIAFNAYTKSEIINILKKRADVGFYSGVMGARVLNRIALHASDLRNGIELLRRAALVAEQNASRFISEAHAVKAVEQLKKEKPEIKKIVLSSEEEIVLEILKTKNQYESGELFDVVCKKKKIGYTTFYRFLKSLESKNKITI